MNKRENIQELWTRAAEQFGAATAISTQGREVSYEELEALSNNLANFLISSGAATGSMVVLFMEDTVEVIAATIASLKIGGVFVPIDPNIPDKRLAAQLAEVTPQFFVTETKLLPRLVNAFAEAAVQPTVVCVDSAGYSAYQNHKPVVVPYDPNQMCYVYFTSGSTGRPKAIAGRLKGIDHFIRWEIKTFGVEPGTRVSQFTTPSFDAFLRDIFVPLVAGGTVCVP